MILKHDPEADAMYIRFSPEMVAKTRTVKANRSSAAVDYAADGTLVGVELLGVSTGVDLKGLPNAQAIGELLREQGYSLIGPVESDRERVERFLRTIVHGFMGHDLHVAIDGKANFLAALGLLHYTEILGGLVLGNLDAPPHRKFEAFLPYLGDCYLEVDRRAKGVKGKGLYSFRSSLTHSYGLKSVGNIRMGIDRQGRCGIEFDEIHGWDFCVQQYFHDFRRGVEKLRSELRDRPDLVRNFVQALGSALDI